MALLCPNCNAGIEEGDVNVTADIAKCAACGEVFRPSIALGAPPAQPPQDAPPVPQGPPEGTKVRIEQFGGEFTVRFPPAGFNVGLIFLGAFAIAWWSFLFTFVGFGVSGFLKDKDKAKSTAEQPDSPKKPPAPAETESAEKQPDGEKRGSSMPAVFIFLFLTPFFVAGFAMIGGILWPLFGRTAVWISGGECCHKASLFGIGRTRRAPLGAARLAWKETAARSMPHAKWVRRLGGVAMPRIRLCLGSWNTQIGGHLSDLEQEWLFHELQKALSGGH